MKKRRGLCMLLSLCMTLGMLPVHAGAAPSASRITELGAEPFVTNPAVFTNKTVSGPDKNGQYTLTLESYVTGTVTTEQKSVPTDIVLVLDQSGSMAWPLESEAVYGPSLNKTKTYWVKADENYEEVSWCSDCGCWTTGCRNTKWGHQQGTVYTPKISAVDSIGQRTFFLNNKVSRLNGLKTAANGFIAAVREKAKGKDGIAGTADDVAYRISVVGFGSAPGSPGGSDDYGDNTELLTVTGSNSAYQLGTASGTVGVRYNQLSQTQYKASLVDSSSVMLDRAIAALSSSGATRTDYGLSMAQQVLSQNPLQEGETRNRLVVLFTDGVPTSANAFDTTVANNAIRYAKNSKAAGAQVYTVGIFEGAAGGHPFTRPAYEPIRADDSAAARARKETAAANRFMQLASSNYPAATALIPRYNGEEVTGSVNSDLKPGDKGYYLSASDANSLNEVFESIAKEIATPAITLGTDTVVRDVIAPQFAIPTAAAADAVKVYTAPCIGQNADGAFTFGEKTALAAARVTVSADGRQVSTAGYDFSAQFVAKNTDGSFRGSKLIVEIPVTAVHCLGGNQIRTNGDDTALYDKNGTLVAHFPRPTVDLQPQPAVQAAEQWIYLGNAASYDGLLRAPGSVQPDGVNNAYVTLSYTVKNASGTVLGTYTVPAGAKAAAFDPDWWIPADAAAAVPTADTVYTLICTVTPTKTGTYAAHSDCADAAVHLLAPTVTWSDDGCMLGEAVSLRAKQPVSVRWAAPPQGKTASGAAPALRYAFAAGADASGTLAAAVFTPDTAGSHPMEVQTVTAVNASGTATDITAGTGFAWQGCADEAAAALPAHGSAEASAEFYVHVQTCSLTVRKSGCAAVDGSDPANPAECQSFLFTVTGANGQTFRFAVQGNGSRTIKGLPVGTYTVTEDGGWSWRYTPKTAVQTATLSSTAPDGTVICENTRTERRVLNGDNYKINRFESAAKDGKEG